MSGIEKRIRDLEELQKKELSPRGKLPFQIKYEMNVAIGQEPTEEEIEEAIRRNPYREGIVLLDVPHKEGVSHKRPLEINGLN